MVGEGACKGCAPSEGADTPGTKRRTFPPWGGEGHLGTYLPWGGRYPSGCSSNLDEDTPGTKEGTPVRIERSARAGSAGTDAERILCGYGFLIEPL